MSVPVFDSEICDWLIGSKWFRSPSTRSDLRPSTKSEVRKACGGPWIICKHDIRISLSLVFTMSWLSILPKFQPGGEGQHFPASARAVVQVGWSCPPTRSRTSVVESLNMWRRGLGQTLRCLCCWWSRYINEGQTNLILISNSSEKVSMSRGSSANQDVTTLHSIRQRSSASFSSSHTLQLNQQLLCKKFVLPSIDKKGRISK